VEQAKRRPSRKGAFVVLIFGCVVFAAGVALLIQSLLTSRLPAPRDTISEIVSNPAAWEGKEVEVAGTLQKTAVGIIRPFNCWLSERANQTMRIGVKWDSEGALAGQAVRVVGVVRRGYAWVHPDYPGWWVYFIEASSIHEIV